MHETKVETITCCATYVGESNHSMRFLISVMQKGDCATIHSIQTNTTIGFKTMRPFSEMVFQSPLIYGSATFDAQARLSTELPLEGPPCSPCMMHSHHWFWMGLCTPEMPFLPHGHLEVWVGASKHLTQIVEERNPAPPKNHNSNHCVCWYLPGNHQKPGLLRRCEIDFATISRNTNETWQGSGLVRKAPE